MLIKHSPDRRMRAGAANEPQSKKRSGETLASVAYQRLRENIIGGQHAYGGKLRVQELSRQYGVGPSPIREALNRLSRDGLVTLSDHKGFSVTPLNRAHLEQLTITRCWLNELAVRQSIAKGDQSWEEGVVLAYHRLSRIPRYASDEDKAKTAYSPAWELAHRAFHTSLIAACGSHWLIGFCEQMFDAATCYRHLSRVTSVKRGPRNDEHKEMVNAIVLRDADRAVELLNRHFRSTAELVRERLDD